MARLRPLFLIPPAVFAALAGTFLWGMLRDNPDALPTALAGRDAPIVRLVKMGPEEPFTDATLRDGKVKLVNFWASWCAPCRVEHPTLTALAAEGIPIYGVNYKDKPDAALGFLDELGNPYAAIGADETGRMGIEWGLYGVPETFVIDGQGKVVMRFAGPVTERALENDIRPALAKASGQ